MKSVPIDDVGRAFDEGLPRRTADDRAGLDDRVPERHGSPIEGEVDPVGKFMAEQPEAVGAGHLGRDDVDERGAAPLGSVDGDGGQPRRGARVADRRGELGHRAAAAQHLRLDLDRSTRGTCPANTTDMVRSRWAGSSRVAAIARSAIAAMTPPWGTTTSIHSSTTLAQYALPGTTGDRLDVEGAPDRGHGLPSLPHDPGARPCICRARHLHRCRTEPSPNAHVGVVQSCHDLHDPHLADPRHRHRPGARPHAACRLRRQPPTGRGRRTDHHDDGFPAPRARPPTV